MRSVSLALGVLIAPALPAFAQQLPPMSPAGEALHQSAFGGDLAMVERLIGEGLNVDVADRERHTPLMWAAFNGHTEVVAYLLDHGADVEARDINGRAALMYGSSGDFPETVGLLLKKGAKVNLQGELEGFTALMTAAAEGHVKVVRLLLLYGADPALKDKDGDTAETFATQNGHAAVIELLRSPPAAAEKP